MKTKRLGVGTGKPSASKAATAAVEPVVRVDRDRDGYVRCRVCGCTEREPCEPPCLWVDYDLCSLCAQAAEALVEWVEGAHRPSNAALWREVERVRQNYWPSATRAIARTVPSKKAARKSQAKRTNA